MGNPIPSNKHKIIVNKSKIITLSFAIDSITIIKFVLKPVDPTAPTITPAVAIATPTAIMLIAPFCRPTTVSFHQSDRFSFKLLFFLDVIALYKKFTETSDIVA